MEAILAADPDTIFIVLQSNEGEAARASLEPSLLSDPAWQQLRAVQSGACHYLDQRLYNLKPNARWGEAYGVLAEILYGDPAATAGSAGTVGFAGSAGSADPASSIGFADPAGSADLTNLAGSTGLTGSANFAGGVLTDAP